MGEVEEKTVFILGSCVTRDAIEDKSNNFIDLVGYMARTSMASQSSPPWIDNELLDNIDSPFQRRMVAFDMKKSIFNKVENVECDLIIMDLIDDRFDLFEVSKEHYVTRSVEILKGTKGKPIGRVVPHGSDEYEELWEKGVDLFINCLKEHGKLHKLRVNEVYWARKTSSGSEIPGFDEEKIRKENRLLRRRYDLMKSKLPGECFYSFDREIFVADESHKWGVSPFHYAEDYYSALIEKIKLDY